MHAWGGQEASSASELPLWGSKIPGGHLTEGAVSTHLHKGSRVLRFVIHRSQQQRGSGALAGQSSVPGPERETAGGGGRHSSLIRWLGWRSLTFQALDS